MARRAPALLPTLIAVLLGAAPLAGQAPPDTLRRDTTDVTGLLLEAEEDVKVRLPKLPRVGEERLLPVRSRIVLPRDSIDFLNAETVGDVLAEVAGVYLWRGGWLGRPELPNYLGRGATSVEYLVDGVPYLPLGPDSLVVDPSVLPLGFVEGIEIERVPGLLRVHLFLREHDVLAPWSKITVARGQYDQGRYEAMLQKRARSGLGLSVGAAYWISPAFAQDLGDFDAAYGWLEGSYVPSHRVGLRLRYRLTSPDRKAALQTAPEGSDTLSRPIDGRRGDLDARLTLRSRDDVLGRRTDLVINRSTWSGDSVVAQELWLLGAALSHRTPTRSLGASLWYGSRWTRWDGRVSAGWAPTAALGLALEGAYQRHEDGRSSQWLLGRAGISLPLGFAVAGTWRTGQTVTRPSVLEDTAQNLSEREAELRWETRPVGVALRYTRLAAFQPVSFYQYTAVDSFARMGATEWVTASARVAPRQWFTFQGWYSHPLAVGPDGAPPHHSLITAALRSKFLRTFPSGIFDLKLELSVESWGTGVLGRNPDGDAVPLHGATFLRGLIQMQFGGFIIYYDRYNLTDTRSTYVPGFRIPIQAATFGVRWGFHN